MKSTTNRKIAVVGLGYVGIPLAVEFVKNGFSVIGFDVNTEKIAQLNQGIDETGEIPDEDLELLQQFTITDDLRALKEADTYIITVPTPIDAFKQPDLSFLKSASAMVGKYLDKGDLVIYESTVYPGCTEEDCVPELEKASGLKYNVDFFGGYSPERINPGDKERKVHNIVKVTSGSTPEAAKWVDDLYNAIVKVGTYKVSSIKVAEASKIIENTQRDINISLVNEFALIFDRMGIDTLETLEAAGTKWNFLPFRPGLVGGHCISVDPYYLTHKAESVGYYPEVILSGRRINDNMGIYIANRVIKLMVKHDLRIKDAKILVLGITFKENCPDIRNSRVIDMVNELSNFGANIEVYDPYAIPSEVYDEYGIALIPEVGTAYDAIILAVGHDTFLKMDIKALKKKNESVVFDIKSVLPKTEVTDRL